MPSFGAFHERFGVYRLWRDNLWSSGHNVTQVGPRWQRARTQRSRTVRREKYQCGPRPSLAIQGPKGCAAWTLPGRWVRPIGREGAVQPA